MKNYDWYRRTSWSEEDQSDFWARWKRSRSLRPDYLVSQGGTLVSCESPDLRAAGIGLLEKVLKDYPENLIQTSLARIGLGNALCKIGEYDQALDRLRDAVDRELADGDRSRTYADLEFSFCATAYRFTRRYNEAIEMLNIFFKRNPVPMGHLAAFKAISSFAVISSFRGDDYTASVNAQMALLTAAQPNSGINKHPTIQLIPKGREPYKSVIETLRAICG